MPRPDRSRPAEPGTDPTAAIRRAIIRLGEQREKAATEAGRALATHAEVRQALREQRTHLAAALREIDAAVELAAAAADRARADAANPDPSGGTPDKPAKDADETAAERRAAAAAAPYEQACAALRRQRDVVAAAADQLDDLDVISEEQMTRNRELVRASTRSLDDALRDQLRLLIALERAERARIVAAARRTTGRRAP